MGRFTCLSTTRGRRRRALFVVVVVLTCVLDALPRVACYQTAIATNLSFEAPLSSLDSIEQVHHHHHDSHHKMFDYSHNEERLLNHLFKDYNPFVMPRKSANESLKVYFGLALHQLIQIVLHCYSIF